MATDDELRKMEKYLSGIFNQAGKDLMDKALKYMSDFARKDEVKKSKVDSGEITEDEYKEWRKNQLLYGEHWTRLIQLVQKEMADCNKTALDYVNDKATKIFADSYNSIARVIDDSVVEGYSFELVDANTVKNLARSEEIILPPKKNLDVQKDKLWNAKQVNAQLLQGILQGESIPKIAARMQNVCDSNKAASIRNARTMVTAAENSGRQSGMNKAESDGIIFKKMWIATRDERTRESHMVLNGQLVANGEKFVTINGDEIEFPGDWRAEPSEVYNCRCTLGTIVIGYKPNVLRERLEEEPKEQEIQEAEQLEVEIEQQTEPQRTLQPWQSTLLNFNESERGKVELLLVRNNVFANRQEAAALSSEELKAKLEEYITNSAEVFDNGFERAYYYYIDSTGTDYLHTLSKGTKSDIDEVAHNYTRTVKSFELNDALRHDRNLTRFQEQTKDSLMRLIEDNTLNQNTIVTRFAGSHYMNDMLGVPRNELFNIIDNYDSAEAQEKLKELIGKETKPEKSFVSTSGNPKENVFTGKDVQLKIFVEEGANAYIPDNPFETEIIFPPGVVCEVIGFEKFQKNAWDPNDIGLKITMKMKKV